jgi:hypothetical protein
VIIIKNYQRKLVVLSGIKIQIERLEIREEEKNGLLNILRDVSTQVLKGLIIKDFWVKVQFIATLLKRLIDKN